MRQLRPILLILLSFSIVAIFTLDAIKNVQAENISGPFKDGCPRYPVCLQNGAIIKTKYGVLTAQRNMVFNRIDVNANGSIIFDLSNMVPQAEEILLFNAASFGNGTFSLQLLGHSITAIGFGAAYTVQYAIQLTGGLGGIVNLVAGSNMTSALQLVINYTPFGGACVPFCISSSTIPGWIFIILAVILIGLLLMKRNTKKIVKREKEYLVEVGREE